MNQEFKAPEWMKGWKIFLIFSVISFVFAFGLRCLELPKWDNPAFMVGGEYIMGTHDAYYWLAGAKGVGSAVDNPMAWLVKILGGLTGFQYGNIAFWLPAFFAGFTAVAAFSWGLLLSGPWAGLVTACFATSVPAYFFRTRLSYYDTDVVTLLFPLMISLMLARWLKSGLRSKWIGDEGAECNYTPALWDYALPLLAGAVTSFGRLWHSDVMTFGVVAGIIAVGLILLCGRVGDRATLLRGMVLFILAAFFGLPGFLISLIVLAAFMLDVVRKNKFYDQIWGYLLILLVLVVSSGVGLSFIQVVSGKITAYLKPVADSASVTGAPKYPGIAQSVIEAQNISIKVLFNSLTGSEYLGWFGLGGFAFALLFSPLTALLAPFAGVTFAAVSMGGRFSMFGGVPIGLGGAYLLVWILRKIIRKPKPRLLGEAAQAFFLIGLLLLNSWDVFKLSPPTPIMTDSHVKALIESGKKMPGNSTVWTWWDWGYATMYYTGVNSFANGGNHGGKVLFPLGFVFATPSALQSSQMIKFSAANNEKPAETWDKMSPSDVQGLLGAMGVRKFDFPNLKNQYLVVSWENIRLAYWILYYGSWNVKTGIGTHPTVSAIMNEFTVNFEQGILNIKGQPPMRISSYDLLRKGAPGYGTFPGVFGPHLVYNRSNSQGFLVDDFTYASMLFRLLNCSPSDPEFSSSFELIYDGYPDVRIFRVI